jgi:hypothetical protein
MGGRNSRGMRALAECKMDGKFSADECKRIWDRYDTNNNGVLERNEAEQFFRDYCTATNKSRYSTNSEINRLFALFDTNGDGSISWFEMCSNSSSMNRRPPLIRQFSNGSASTALDKVFDRYAGPQSEGYQDMMYEDGFVRFCRDVKLNPENWESYMIAWKLDAKEVGVITRDQFKAGFYDVEAKDIKTIATKMQNLKRQLSSENEMYTAFYMWCFDFFLYEDVYSSKIRMNPGEEGSEYEGCCDAQTNWPILIRNPGYAGPLLFEFLANAHTSESKYEWCNRPLWTDVYAFLKKCKSRSDMERWGDIFPEDCGELPSILEEFLEDWDNKNMQ